MELTMESFPQIIRIPRAHLYMSKIIPRENLIPNITLYKERNGNDSIVMVIYSCKTKKDGSQFLIYACCA